MIFKYQFVVFPAVIVLFGFVSPSLGRRLNYSDAQIQTVHHKHNNNANVNHLQSNQSDDARAVHTNSAAYVRTSIPVKIFRCMQSLNLMRCMKVFLLQRMDRTLDYRKTGNITADFFDQILKSDQIDSDNLDFDNVYMTMDENVLNARLQDNVQRFFDNREIVLHFIPGMVVKVVPSKENTINLSLKRDESAVGTSRGKNRYEYVAQIGLPVMMLPAVFIGTVMPMILPALKFATIATTLINGGLLMSAMTVFAKAHNGSGETPIFINPGLH